MKKTKLIFAIIISIFSIVNLYSQNKILLNGKWKMTWIDGVHGPNSLWAISNLDYSKDIERYLDIDVPKDLNQYFIDKGMIQDVNIGTNTLNARWVAEQYYHYVKTFNIESDNLENRAWIIFDRLDLNAIIKLNGEVITKHNNAFIPCEIEITNKLKAGNNTVEVLLESGIYNVADKDATGYDKNIRSIFQKRHWQRKPQYQYGWDWNPILVNIGITGDVYLKFEEKYRIENIMLLPTLSDNLKTAKVKIRTVINSPEEKTITIKATADSSNKIEKKEFNIFKGSHSYDLELAIENPQLWWPVGLGKQNMTSFTIDLIEDNKTINSKKVTTGIRKVELDRSEHPNEGEYFTLVINNRKVFCKGANWVPADLIYSNVTNERIDTLIDLALESNFNMLRIWGGGEYMNDHFMERCDSEGILIWHDFMFACNKFPGDDFEFVNEVKKEVRYQVRRMANHPSLVLWCGNNESETAWWNWGYQNQGKQWTDYGLFHSVIPTIIKQEDNTKIYWPSSPWAHSYENPRDPTTGDQHPWSVSLREDGPNFWAYRNHIDRFADEGGVLGASSPKTIKEFLPKNQQYIRSFSWEHHDNSMNTRSSEPGINYETIKYWLNKDYSDFSMDDYIFASSILQSEGLIEYINNYRRRMYSSSAAVYWMFNDSWPTTHGWTTIDYYLREKLAFHPVRRSFQNISIVVAKENDSLFVYGINDTDSDFLGNIIYGITAFNGEEDYLNSKEVALKANSSTKLGFINYSKWIKLGTEKYMTFAQLKKDENLVSQHRLFETKFGDLELVKPEIKITRDGDYAVFYSDVFVWGVVIDFDGDKNVSDNCFDIYPGSEYRLKWSKDKDLPEIEGIGNYLILSLKKND